MENWTIGKNKVIVNFFEWDPKNPKEKPIFQHRTFPDKSKAISWIDTVLCKREVEHVEIKTFTELTKANSDGNI